MANLGFSGLAITDMNGRIGQFVITRNSYGPYAKTALTAFPVAPTPAMISWQSSFSSIHNTWVNTLTDSQRHAWQEAAIDGKRIQVLKSSLGNSFRARQLTGFHYFMSVNLNIASTSFTTFLLDPPVFRLTQQIPRPYFGTVDPVTIEINIPPLPPNIAVVNYFTVNVSPGRMSTNQIFYNINNTITGAGLVDVWPDFFLRFSQVPVSTMKLFWKTYGINLNTGQRTPPYISSIIVA